MSNEDERVGIGRDNPVVGIVFLLWFVCSIAILYLAAKGSLPLYMITIGLGQFFLGFTGIIGVSIVKSLRRHKAQVWGHVGFMLLLLISVGLIAVGLLQKSGTLTNILAGLPKLICGRELENDGFFYAALFAGAFFLAALALVLENIAFRMSRKKHCTETVAGTCTEMKSRLNHNASHPRERIAQAPVFQYVYDDLLYESCEEIYTSTNQVKEGDRVLIYINPRYPEEFYVEGTGIFHKNILLGSVIMAVISFGFIILCCLNM